MALVTFLAAEFGDPNGSGQRATLRCTYDDGTMDIRSVECVNNTSVPAIATFTNLSTNQIVTQTVPAGQTASQNLPRNRYMLVLDASDGSVSVDPTLRYAFRPG